METKNIVTEYLRCTEGELSPQEQELVKAARKACDSAYAPYSRYQVGAAALLDDGRILTGSNQESPVFPSGLCAERVLLYQIKAACPDREILAVALAAKSAGKLVKNEVRPCGACAQVFADAAARQQRPLRLILSGTQGCTVLENAGALLPFAFEM